MWGVRSLQWTIPTMDPCWRTPEYHTIIQWRFIVGRISVLTFSVILGTIQRCQKKVSGALHHLVVSNTVYEIKIFSPLESYVIIIPLLLIHYYRPHHNGASPLKSCFIITISIYFSLHLWYQSTTASQPNTKQQGARALRVNCLSFGICEVAADILF